MVNFKRLFDHLFYLPGAQQRAFPASVLKAIEDDLTRMGRLGPVLARALGPVPLGRIVSCDGGMIEVSGLNAPIGTLCRSRVGHGDHAPAAEVVGFRGGRSLMMLLGDTVRLQPGTLVRAEGRPGMVMVGEEFLGRAVDGTGHPVSVRRFSCIERDLFCSKNSKTSSTKEISSTSRLRSCWAVHLRRS